MPLDLTAKLGPEARLFLSSSAQSLLSINLEGVAFENIGGSITWEEVGLVRFPQSRAEPIETVDIYKNFEIDHTKRGRSQRKTGSFVASFVNTSLAVRKYLTTNNLMKIEWHVEGVGATNEYEYKKNLRFTNLTQEIPEGEVVERVDYIWSTYGHRDG